MMTDGVEREFRGGPRDGERLVVKRGIGYVEVPHMARIDREGGFCVTIERYRCDELPDGTPVLEYVPPFHAADDA
jgi:hypothetical protein